ncbi:MAG TPA: hypothetical protein VJ180_04120 [Pyrinomonadaceae bacterium]|nr:hypothetical protein [Pyrinomonadaceae bacterium]
MRTRKLNGLLWTVCCAVITTSFYTAAATGQSRQYINGTMVSIGGRLSRSRPYSLIVNRYTTPAEVRELNDALQRGGQDELLRVLSRMDAGRIRIGSGVGVTANAILAEPWGEGGTKLTVLYERDVRFFELRYGTRSQDYRIGYAEIFLDRRGRGEGTLIPAARVRLRDGKTWEVEDFGVYPARLMGLRSSGQAPIG